MAFRCTVLTPERIAYEGDVESAILPAFDGELGILPGHADFLGALGIGVAHLRSPGGESRFALRGGYVRVDRGTLTILAEEAAAPAEADAAVADKDLRAALAERPRERDEADARDGRVAWARARRKLTA